MRRLRLTLIASLVAAVCRVCDYGETADIIAVVSVALITHTLFSSPMSWEAGTQPRTPAL